MSRASFRNKVCAWGALAFLLSGAFAHALVTEYWAVWKLDNATPDETHGGRGDGAGERLLRARDRYGLYVAVETRTYAGGGGRETTRTARPVFPRCWYRIPHLYVRTRISCGAAFVASLGAAARAAASVLRKAEVRAVRRASPAVPVLVVAASAVLYSAWQWESHYDDKWKRRLAKTTSHDVFESDVDAATCGWGCGVAAAAGGALLILAALLVRLILTAVALDRARPLEGTDAAAAAKCLEAAKRDAAKARDAARGAHDAADAAARDAAKARAADVV